MLSNGMLHWGVVVPKAKLNENPLLALQNIHHSMLVQVYQFMDETMEILATTTAGEKLNSTEMAGWTESTIRSSSSVHEYHETMVHPTMDLKYSRMTGYYSFPTKSPPQRTETEDHPFMFESHPTESPPQPTISEYHELMPEYYPTDFSAQATTSEYHPLMSESRSTDSSPQSTKAEYIIQ